MLLHLEWLYEAARDHGPSTKLGWGATAIGSAFVCLLLGAALSWLGRPREDRPVA